jgi:LPXTG-site transpeptidase (sortase) family protein
MSQTRAARFKPTVIPLPDNNPAAADSARRRIAELPDPYLAHAAPAKEDLVGVIHPVSPAAESGRLHISKAGTSLSDLRHPSKPLVSDQATAKPPLETSSQPTTNTSNQSVPKAAPMNTRRRLPSRIKPLITGLITFALLFVAFKSPIFLKQIGYLTAQPASNNSPTVSAQIPPDPVINIPKINVSAPVVFAQSNIEANIQKDLESGVVHYAHTALPGQPGNSVIFGHSSNDWWEPGNFKFVFVLLDKLQVGDSFTVNYESKQYVYQVTETKVVEPTDLSVLAQTPDPQMTLITCTPPGTSWKRLVVKAKQTSPAPQAATNNPANNETGINGSLPGSTPSLTDQIGNWWKGFTELFH